MTDHPGLSEQRARDGMQHVAYFDEGEFHWMSGIKARDCELYAPLTSSAAFAQPPASVVDRSRDGHTLDETGYNCSCHARFSTRWEAAEHAGISHGGPLAALTNSGAPVPGDGAFEQFHAAHFFEHFAAQPLYRRELAKLAFDAGFAAAHAAPAPSGGAPKREGVEAALVECVKRLEQTANRLGAYVEAYGLLHERDDEPLALAAVVIMEAREALNTPKQATPTDEAAVLADHIREQITHVQQRIEDGRAMGATIWRLALEDVVRENKAIIAARPAPCPAGEASDA